MTASIVKQRLLRTGDLEFSATTASDVDQYIVHVNERTDKGTVAELFVAYGGNPIPKGTLKQLGSGFLICDRITVSSGGSNLSLIWHVQVHWKEIESSEPPENQSAPMPNEGSTDPEDWTPSWSRRTQIIFEPATDGFYKGGFPENTRGRFDQEAYGANRAPIQNSAGELFETSLEKRRKIYVWSFRWLRPSIPETLMNAEGKANSAEFNFVRNSYAFVFEPRTAYIDTVDLTKMRWGNLNLVEIAVEIVQDPNGIYWKIRDQGFNRRAEPGIDKNNQGVTISGPSSPDKAKIQRIVDHDGKAVSVPRDLDGDGKLRLANGPIIYPKWSDFQEVDFNTVALLSAL